MSQQIQSLRQRRTQKLLREALIELIEEQGFDSLTVGEITERAMVSRAAFYRNYQDKYDLVEQIFTKPCRLCSMLSQSQLQHILRRFGLSSSNTLRNMNGSMELCLAGKAVPGLY